MLPKTRRKVKALMVIAMMVVAEGRRIELESHFGDAAKEHAPGAPSSHDPEAANTFDSATDRPLELDTLFTDPAFVKQIEAMAGHMDKCVDTMKSKTSVRARANEMTRELSRLTEEPSSYVDSTLPEQMEAIIADPKFQEQAQVFAGDMQKSMKEWELEANIDFQSELGGLSAALNTQHTSMPIAEKFYGVMSDPKIQQYQERVSNGLDSLLLDSDLQRQAQSTAASVESLKDSTQDSYEAKIAQVSEQIDAMMANTKLQGMLKVLRDDLDSTATAWIAENAELQGMQLSNETAQPSLLEAGQANGQDVSPLPLVAGTAAKRFSVARKPSVVRQQQRRLSLMPRMGPDTTSKAVHNLSPRRHQPLTMHSQPAPTPRLGITALKAIPINNSIEGPAPERSDFSRDLSELVAKLPPAAEVPDLTRLDAPNVGSVPRISSDDVAVALDSFDRHFVAVQPGSALTSAGGIRSMMPSLVKVLRQLSKDAVTTTDGKKRDFSLLLCLAMWYLGYYFYNVTNKLALTAAGGAAGFPMTIATLQLGVGAVYALFMWLAPDARKKPEISFKDYAATMPVSVMAAGAQAAGVFALSAGSVSFAQIVKASEPAFAAVIGTLIYRTRVSKAKWLTLIPVIGGVCLASLGELNFAIAALVTAALSNVFTVVRENENSKLLSAPGLSERIGSVGNLFALTIINAFLLSLPLMLGMEGHKLGEFLTLTATDPVVRHNLVASGLWHYVYAEFATRVVKKTNPVTRAVASTAGRAILIVVMALVMQESLTPLKLIGTGMGLGGVYLYSIIDKLVAARREKQLQKAESAS